MNKKQKREHYEKVFNDINLFFLNHHNKVLTREECENIIIKSQSNSLKIEEKNTEREENDKL